MVLNVPEISPKVTGIITLSKGWRGVQERPPCHSLKMTMSFYMTGVFFTVSLIIPSAHKLKIRWQTLSTSQICLKSTKSGLFIFAWNKRVASEYEFSHISINGRILARQILYHGMKGVLNWKFHISLVLLWLLGYNCATWILNMALNELYLVVRISLV